MNASFRTRSVAKTVASMWFIAIPGKALSIITAVLLFPFYLGILLGCWVVGVDGPAWIEAQIVKREQEQP